MVNEIVKTVAKKANISEPIAQIAVDVVLKSLKDKLPSTLGSALNSFLGGSSAPATTTSSSSKSKPTTKVTKTTSTSPKKADNPLGDLVAGTLGSLLGKK